MRTLATLMLAQLVLLPLCSCTCNNNCNGYNSDYLRDVKPATSQSFDSPYLPLSSDWD